MYIITLYSVPLIRSRFLYGGMYNDTAINAMYPHTDFSAMVWQEEEERRKEDYVCTQTLTNTNRVRQP